MRQNPALDIAVFQSFDAVHACLSRLLPPVIELSFPAALECRPTPVGFTGDD